MKLRFLLLTSVAMAVGTFFSSSLALGQESWLGEPDYQNTIGIDYQDSVAFFNGFVGAPGDAGTPSFTDGVETFYVTQANFGMPVATGAAGAYFGQPITPGIDAEVDLTRAPDLDPSNGVAVWIANVNEAGEGRVFGMNSGVVIITWKDANGNPIPESETLSIIPALLPENERDPNETIPFPAGQPVAVYHTHSPGLAMDTNGPDTRAPIVDFSNTPAIDLAQLQIHYNPAIPDSGFFVINGFKQINAREKTGLVLLEYRDSGGDFLGVEAVNVRENTPEVQDGLFDIGSRLLPTFPAFGPSDRLIPILNAEPLVTVGINNINTGESIVYQHQGVGDWKGEVHAIKRTGGAIPFAEVYWRRRGIAEVTWPYQLRHYIISWPSDPEVFQAYVRDEAANLGPEVNLPEALGAEIMPFQEPANLASITNNAFTTIGPGHSLLKFTPQVGQNNTAVSFQVVRSVDHEDPAYFSLDAVTPEGGNGSWDIGRQILPVNLPSTFDQAGSPIPRGHIQVPLNDPHSWNRYDWEVYDGVQGAITGQIFGVNTGQLEVWWYSQRIDSNSGLVVEWPSFVQRYQTQWPAPPFEVRGSRNEKIIVARQDGTGRFEPADNQELTFYHQNDPNAPGFNPNDEHALLLTPGEGPVFALRDDLGSLETSLPYVLVKYRDTNNGDVWKYEVYPVVAEAAPFVFNYPWRAGLLLQSILPLSAMPPAMIPDPANPLQQIKANRAAPGLQKIFRDRNGDHWTYAGGDNGGSDTIEMQWFYPARADFFFPDAPHAREGEATPLLDRRPADTPTGSPTNIVYTVYWPDLVPESLRDQIGFAEVPQLRVGETLINAKNGLPAIKGQLSARIAYQQSTALDVSKNSVDLIDPIKTHSVDLDLLPGDVDTQNILGQIQFSKLPPHLRQRLTYSPLQGKLSFQGQLIEPAAGQPYLLPNILTERDRAVLDDPEIMGSDPALKGAINALFGIVSQASIVPSDSLEFFDLALTAGFATGTGYVTLVFANNPDLSGPVAFSIIKVTPPLYRGALRNIFSANPFDERSALRFDGDLAGRSDDYVFEWRTLPATGGIPETHPLTWNLYPTQPSNGLGANDITIGGPGLFTLTDNWFVCRYRPLNTDILALVQTPQNTEGWSDWTWEPGAPANPGFVPGWIKRVLDGINPFEQRFSDLGDPAKTANTLVSMLSQAGKRWEGAIPLNPDEVDNLGLIEVYETVLRRGMDLSVNAGFDLAAYPAVANALLLAAGRLSDLYMLLGNEAFADAADPTIQFGINPSQTYQAPTSVLHSFMGLAGGASLLDEELTLLRGRDDQFLPSPTTAPIYNRFIWNFKGGDGEAAYALNYGIRDHDNNGFINESDAVIDYPQGHGDAWGHYATAIKNYYRLIRNPNYLWVPRSETVLIGGVPVSVDYLDERNFARVGAARARTAAEIVSLTYRANYTEDPAGQSQGYKDNDPQRAWGLDEWGSRGGQAALLDWVVSNALLPDEDTVNTGISKIDRTTVLELRDTASAIHNIQAEVDKADRGLNPLGLARDVLPVDVDPSAIASGHSHFEQIRDRAITTLNNAIAVYNVANGSSQKLREQFDQLSDYQNTVDDREADFRNRLIEIFGTPYPEDIGGTGTYPNGYDGADIYNFSLIKPSELVGMELPEADQVSIDFTQVSADKDSGEVTKTPVSVTFPLSRDGFGKIAPSHWGERQSAGSLQEARSNLVQLHFRLQSALASYDNLLSQIDDSIRLLEEQHDLNADQIDLLVTNKDHQKHLGRFAFGLRKFQELSLLAAERVQKTTSTAAEAVPNSVIVGFSSGGDITSVQRAAIKTTGSEAAFVFKALAQGAAVAELEVGLAKQNAEAQTNIDLQTNRNESSIQQALASLAALVRQEAPRRLEIYTLIESLKQSATRYQATLARGYRQLEDLNRFRRDTAANIQESRYKDMAYRIFRNDALQKYRAQFDLAAAYVYMAARAYDYETNMLDSDSRGPGQEFLTDIIRTRAIGEISGGAPIAGSGLADPLARMNANWSVLEGQLGINNPQNETNRFSLRQELFRIPRANSDWREVLERHVVPNLHDVPAFNRFCRPFQGQNVNSAEPGFVIPLTNLEGDSAGVSITFGLNFFGHPLGPGDNAYDSSHFATKVRSVGVWFSNYNTSGLSNTPRVYLVPAGNDIFRSPTDGSVIREWKVVEQRLPVPFPVSGSAINDPSWSPLLDSLGSNFTDIRQFSSFRAYHDSGSFREEESINNTRLVGRSVWNTDWLLIIPAGSLLADREVAIDRFINGSFGSGISDIKLLFQTYAFSGG